LAKKSKQRAIQPFFFKKQHASYRLLGCPTLAKDIKTSKGYPTLLFQKTNICKLENVGLSNPCKRHQNIKGLSNPSFSKKQT